MSNIMFTIEQLKLQIEEIRNLDRLSDLERQINLNLLKEYIEDLETWIITNKL